MEQQTSSRARAFPRLGVVKWWPLVGVAVATAFACAVLWKFDAADDRFGEQKNTLIVWSTVVCAIAVVVLLQSWSRSHDATVRAAVLILIGLPAVLIGCGSFLWILKPVWQLNAIRTVVSLLLFLCPAILWWLFLAARRASMLNEFLANVQRLGLLAVRRSVGESEQARATRIDSYLLKFEGTYGRIPQAVHDDVIGHQFGPYSREEVRAQPPMSVSIVPVSIAVVVLAIGWIYTYPPIWGENLGPDPLFALFDIRAKPVSLAFLGAYFFCIQMLFRRYVRSDLRGNAYMAVVMRIVLALIVIWVLQSAYPTVAGLLPGMAPPSQKDPLPNWMLVLGFVVGVFPTVGWQVIRKVFASVFAFAAPSLKAGIGLDQLDGLTVWHEARLEEEDIENVPNMATADVVGLLIDTRISPERIVDWVDQAILLTCLGADGVSGPHYDSARKRLSRRGIRTASGLLAAAAAARRDGWSDTFARILDDDAMPSLLAAIGASSNLDLVLEWRGMAPADDGGGDGETTGDLLRRNVEHSGPAPRGSGHVHQRDQVGTGGRGAGRAGP